jgi:hypothetical protein
LARPSPPTSRSHRKQSDQEIPRQRHATNDGCAAAPGPRQSQLPLLQAKMQKCSQTRPAQSQWASGGAARRGRSQVVLSRPGTANVTARWCRPSARAGARDGTRFAHGRCIVTSAGTSPGSRGLQGTGALPIGPAPNVAGTRCAPGDWRHRCRVSVETCNGHRAGITVAASPMAAFVRSGSPWPRLATTRL